MKTYKEEIAESGNDAFARAIDDADHEEELEDAVELPIAGIDPDDIDVVMEDANEVVEEPKETEDKTDAVLNKLADALMANQPKPEKKTPKARPSIPQVNISEVQKEFNEKLHDSEDPFTVAMEATQKVFGSQIAAQARELQELKKEVLKKSDEHALVFDKYGAEIEDVVANLPANQQDHPDVYGYAVNKVTQEHMNDIVEARVKAELEKQAVTTRPGATATLGKTSGTTPTKRRRTVRATKTDEAMAARYGMKLKDYLIAQGKI